MWRFPLLGLLAHAILKATGLQTVSVGFDAGLKATGLQTISVEVNGDTPVKVLPRKLHVGTSKLIGHTKRHGAVRWPGGYTSKWLSQNPGWKLDALTDARIMGLAEERFPAITSFLQSGVKIGVERSDLGRLLALEAEGGVYVDNDVEPILPIDQWPGQFGYEKNAFDMILGMEFPQATETNPMQITNWAMAAVPGNFILRRAIQEIVKRAPSVPDTNKNVMKRTGPAALTSVLMEVLEEHGVALPDLNVFKEGNGHVFHFQDNGTLVKVLILPYRAFGYHPAHKNMFGNNSQQNNLVHHSFWGRWRTNSRPRLMK